MVTKQRIKTVNLRDGRKDKERVRAEKIILFRSYAWGQPPRTTMWIYL